MRPSLPTGRPALVGIETCASAHRWARKLQALGHTVRLMAPQFVKPYVKSNKNDAADAEAISRPSARIELDRGTGHDVKHDAPVDIVLEDGFTPVTS